MDAASTIATFGASVFTIVLLLGVALLLSSYVKIVTVLSILRTGFGIYSLPSVFITSGLALALTFFVMYPTLNSSLSAVDGVLRQGAVTDQLRAQALNAGLQQWKTFLVKHTADSEKQRFVEAAGSEQGQPTAAVDSWRVLVPAFVVSELKEAFSTGLSLFLPFFVIDLLTVVIMAALGVDRLDPVLVAFPFKLLLFVTVDGWGLIAGNLAAAYR